MGRKKISSTLLNGNPIEEKRTLKMTLLLNDITPTEVARQLGIKTQSVSGVLNRRDNSTRILKFIEDLPIQALQI